MSLQTTTRPGRPLVPDNLSHNATYADYLTTADGDMIVVKYRSDN